MYANTCTVGGGGSCRTLSEARFKAGRRTDLPPTAARSQ